MLPWLQLIFTISPICNLSLLSYTVHPLHKLCWDLNYLLACGSAKGVLEATFMVGRLLQHLAKGEVIALEQNKINKVGYLFKLIWFRSTQNHTFKYSSRSCSPTFSFKGVQICLGRVFKISWSLLEHVFGVVLSLYCGSQGPFYKFKKKSLTAC